jgi:hypothetical protein
VKQKDIVYLLLAVVILLVAGYVGYTQLVPQKASSKTVEVEKVGVIPETLGEDGMKALSDVTKVRDYSSPVDLTNLNNKAVFGPRSGR